MKLELKRRYKGTGYTIGSLLVDGKYFCDTLEDVDRGLTDAMTEAEIAEKKVKGQTAIPVGVYYMTLRVQSPRFRNMKFYSDVCRGYLPRILSVKGFSGVLVHCGNTSADTEGCIIIGENKVKGRVINSKATFTKLYPLLKAAADRNETIALIVS